MSGLRPLVHRMLVECLPRVVTVWSHSCDGKCAQCPSHREHCGLTVSVPAAPSLQPFSASPNAGRSCLSPCLFESSCFSFAHIPQLFLLLPKVETLVGNLALTLLLAFSFFRWGSQRLSPHLQTSHCPGAAP